MQFKINSKFIPAGDQPQAVEKLVDLDVPVRAQALRVILTELQRIASHLVWLGTSGLDLAAMSMFLYCFREREQILDIFSNYLFDTEIIVASVRNPLHVLERPGSVPISPPSRSR